MAAASIQTRPLTLHGPAGREYDARLFLPPPDRDNGHSVLLIGGGYGWDMHWTVPGESAVAKGGEPQRITIDGRPTRDADRLANALARAGFAVLQWSSVHRDDLGYPDDWGRIEGVTLRESVELTRAALRLLRGQPEIEPDRVILLAYSLGAVRAAEVADEGVAGLVFLAGAFLSRVDEPASRADDEAFETTPGLDQDGDGVATREEWNAWTEPLHAGRHRGLAPSFEALDRDEDGLLRGWEIAAWDRLRRLASGETGVLSEERLLRGEHIWPIDALVRSPERPALAVFGGLDPMFLHGPLLERVSTAAGLHGVEVVYEPHLGHLLSPEKDGLVGPMAPRVLDLIVGWLSERFGRAAAAGAAAAGADAEGADAAPAR